MQKLFIAAAALAFAATTGVALVGQAQAAPAMDPMCKMGYVTGNSYAVSESWADHYGCWHWSYGEHPRMVAVVARHEARYMKDPMCKMSYVTGNSYAVSESWADHYHCW